MTNWVLYLEKPSIARWINPLRFPKKTFGEEKDKGSWKKIFEILLIAGSIRVISYVLQTYMSLQSPAVRETVVGLEDIILPQAILFSSLAVLLNIALKLPFYSFIIHVLSIMVGGQGKFRQQTYLISLFVAPLIILQSLLGLILVPLIFVGISIQTLQSFGGVLVSIFNIYGLYLLVLALATVHGFTNKKALSVLLLPLLILLVIWLIQGASGPLIGVPLKAVGNI